MSTAETGAVVLDRWLICPRALYEHFMQTWPALLRSPMLDARLHGQTIECAADAAALHTLLRRDLRAAERPVVRVLAGGFSDDVLRAFDGLDGRDRERVHLYRNPRDIRAALGAMTSPEPGLLAQAGLPAWLADAVRDWQRAQVTPATTALAEDGQDEDGTADENADAGFDWSLPLGELRGTNTTQGVVPVFARAEAVPVPPGRWLLAWRLRLPGVQGVALELSFDLPARRPPRNMPGEMSVMLRIATALAPGPAALEARLNGDLVGRLEPLHWQVDRLAVDRLFATATMPIDAARWSVFDRYLEYPLAVRQVALSGSSPP